MKVRKYIAYFLYCTTIVSAQTPIEYDVISQSLQAIQPLPSSSLNVFQSSARPAQWRDLLVADMEILISKATLVKNTARASVANAINVPVGGDFQNALSNAKPGDYIVLQAGATYSGSFTLPLKNSTEFITITSSRLASLPGAGQRVTPADASSMPKIISPSGPAIVAKAGAHHYRFIGVEIGAGSSGVYSASPRILLGPNAQSEAELPSNIEFDRVFVHGDPIGGGKRGIEANGKAIVIKNSWISDFMGRGQETQAICAWNTPGPLEITNNYLAASGMSILIGGAEPSIVGVHPSDITITQNLMTKPLAWQQDKTLTIKNSLEIKAGQRVTIIGNIFENVWVSAQTGYSILLKPGITTVTPTITTDVLVENNIIRHSAGGVNIVGTNDYGGIASNLTIRNNLFDDIGGAQWGGPMPLVMLLLAPANVTFENNTATQMVTPTSMASVDGLAASGFVFRGNIFPHGAYGIKGSGSTGGNPTLARFFPGAIFTKNVLFGNGNVNPATYPAGNFFPASASQIGWLNMSDQYRLTATSTYAGVGVDGQDPGANLDAILDVTANTMTGRR